MAIFDKPNLVNIVWASGGDRVIPDPVKVATGWLAEVPPRQYFNYIDWKQDQWIAYSNQRGIPEWDNETEYLSNRSFVQASDGSIYQCLVTGIDIEPTTDTQNRWRRVAIEEAPVNGRQFVRRNRAWQELDSTAFAPAVHTHGMNQVIGLENALNNKLSVTGTTPTLNSASSISIRLDSTPADTQNMLLGRSGGSDNWRVGKTFTTSDDIYLDSIKYNTHLILRSDRVLANRDLYVNTSMVWHEGNFTPANYANVVHVHSISQVTGLQSALDNTLKNTTGGEQTITSASSCVINLSATGTGSNYIRGRQDGTNRWYLGEADGGVNTIFNSYRHSTAIQLRAGDVYATKAIVSAGNIQGFSDERLKTMTGTLEGTWDRVKEIKSYYHFWNDKAPESLPRDVQQIAFSAQEVQRQFPELVSNTEGDILAMDYGKMCVVLLDVVKQLQERVEALEGER